MSLWAHAIKVTLWQSTLGMVIASFWAPRRKHLCATFHSAFTYLNRWHMGLWYCQCVQQRSTFPCQRSWAQWGKSLRCRYRRYWRPLWSQTSQSFPVSEQHSGVLKKKRGRGYLDLWMNSLAPQDKSKLKFSIISYIHLGWWLIDCVFIAT